MEDYRELAPHFDAGLKRPVMETATAITEAFAGTNKAERQCLERLGKLLA
jgi:hypothetical protein